MAKFKKNCRCGARPVWMAERGVRKRGRPTGDAERLACPVCGNTTAAGTSREEIAREWNDAGWCGQDRPLPLPEPFGDGWLKVVMCHSKPELARRYRNAMRENQALRDTVRRLRRELNLSEFAGIVKRLVQRGTLAPAGKAVKA